jgi:hypothetical protein
MDDPLFKEMILRPLFIGPCTTRTLIDGSFTITIDERRTAISKDESDHGTEAVHAGS